jgi:chromosome partitioning protein
MQRRANSREQGTRPTTLVVKRERPGGHPVFQNIGAVSAAKDSLRCSLPGGWTDSKPCSLVYALRLLMSVIASTHRSALAMALKPTTSKSRRVIPRSPASSRAAASERPQRFATPNELAGLPTGMGLRRSPNTETKEGIMTTTTTVANQKGGVGKTTTAANIAVLLAHRRQRALVIDTDPQCALTRQLGLGDRALGVNLVHVLAGRAVAQDAIVTAVHGVDVIAGARELAGVEMSLVGELGRERFLHDALEPILDSYDQVVIDTPPNLGLLTVNALVCADRVIAPVSAEDEGAVHGILELKATIAKLERLGVSSPALFAVMTRWVPQRLSSQTVETALTALDLPPAGRIRLRAAAVAHAANARVPLAASAPDGTVALAYRSLLDRLDGVHAR